jgi:hypothetical protein
VAHRADRDPAAAVHCRKNMVRLLWAVREAAGDATIRMEDIIDLDPDNPANWE